jgi:GTP-binding protein
MLAMRFSVNNSPPEGRAGSKVTSRMIRKRPLREAKAKVKPCLPRRGA